MGLLGERPEVSVDRSDEPKLLCLDDDQTEEVLRRLSSESSQAVFRAVTEEPMAAAEVAEALDMSVQNASYHLDNLESAGLIEVLDIHYSEKGQEVDIYGPPEEPLCSFWGHPTTDPASSPRSSASPAPSARLRFRSLSASRWPDCSAARESETGFRTIAVDDRRKQATGFLLGTVSGWSCQPYS